MKKDVKNLWIAALRSGEYEQGHSRLFSQGRKFCCLGVLCDIVQKHAPELGYWEAKHSYRDNVFHYKGDFSATSLPRKLEDDLGLKYDPEGDLRPVVSTLIDQNDCLGKSFDDIADWIDSHIPGED